MIEAQECEAPVGAHEEGLGRVLHRLEGVVHGLEPERMAGADAARLLELVIRAKRVCGAAEALLAARVQESNAWRADGYRSPAQWLASRAGTSIGAAVDVLATGERLADCPRTAQAFRAGELSEVQVREITEAVVADPTAETELLDAAGTCGLQGLRERCRAVRAAAEPDEMERYQRIHRARSLRHWTDRDGAGCGAWRLTPDAHARVCAAIDAHLEHVFAQARQEGRRESREAYAADALVALADGVPAKAAGVQVVIDHERLSRGNGSGACEIPGVGPIPADIARTLTVDSVITAVVTKGDDVTRVAHLGRSIPANLRRALEIRDPVCAVPGCEQRHGLEIDHRVPFALGGPASLDNLVRLCRWHHRQKHIDGYQLTGNPGDWAWQPPARTGEHAHAPP